MYDAYTVVDKVETILKSYNMKKKLSTCSMLSISLLKLVADLLRVIFFEEHFGEWQARYQFRWEQEKMYASSSEHFWGEGGWWWKW